MGDPQGGGGWGGGKPPPESLLLRGLTRRTEGRRILVARWLTFGSLLAPLGRLLAPFGSLLAPFGSLLAHFGFLLAHFWCPLAHFCSPGESIFSLLLYPGFLFGIFLYFRRKYHAKSYF